MFFGPQPEFFCFANTFLRNAVKWQTLLLLDASVLARYISIFWLKNPSAVHEDFWNTFLNIWICGVSIITNFVMFTRKGLTYAFCRLRFPRVTFSTMGTIEMKQLLMDHQPLFLLSHSI